MCKDAEKPSAEPKTDSNKYKFQFFRECNSNQIPCLPFLSKIIHKKLKLEEYMLNKEAIDSLAMVCVKFPTMLDQVSFSRNGIRDE